MLLAADWAKLITDEKGRLNVLGVIEALSHPLAFPLLRLLPFMPKAGSSYNANLSGASAKAATRAANTQFDESAPTVSQINFPMRAAGGKMDIDINMIAGDTTGVIRAGLLTQKLQDIGARLFRQWFTGDKADVGGAQFEGANNLCADLETVIEAGDDGAVVTSDLMDSLLDLVPGANVILANRTLARQITNLDIGVQKTIVLNQGTDQRQMFVQSYKGIPIIPVLTAPNDTTAAQEEILPFDEDQGDAETCSRVTAARIGMDGVYGIHHKIMELFPPVRNGGLEENDLNWFMAPLATDRKDSIAQLVGVLAEAPEEEAP